MRFHVFASVCVQNRLPARRCVGAYKIFIDYSTLTLQESFYSRFAVARITDDKNNPKTPRRDFRVCRVVVVVIITNRRRVDSRRTRTPFRASTALVRPCSEWKFVFRRKSSDFAAGTETRPSDSDRFSKAVRLRSADLSTFGQFNELLAYPWFFDVPNTRVSIKYQYKKRPFFIFLFCWQKIAVPIPSLINTCQLHLFCQGYYRIQY